MNLVPVHGQFQIELVRVMVEVSLLFVLVSPSWEENGNGNEKGRKLNNDISLSRGNGTGLNHELPLVPKGDPFY